MQRSFKTLLSGINSPAFECAVDARYAAVYGDFFDILFVDSSGYVFYSIKKERDYHYYRPSHEPAAFFTVSLLEHGKHLGWFVLQMSTNSTNQILTESSDLGRTGEV